MRSFLPLLIVAAFCARAQGASPEPSAPTLRTPAQVGSLHRAAATFESVLDLYRLSLVELVVATRRVREAGGADEATPSDPPPEPVVEVYARIARTLRHRIPEASLPPIARGYHAEAMDALDALAAADHLHQIPGPSRAFVVALRELARSAHAVVDLFSRKRPILARVIDQSAIYDELSDALDEFAAAEEEINVRRRQRANPDGIAGAFRRTEIALGHLLDVWAAARQMGIDLTATDGEPIVDMQIPPQISTAVLELIVARVELRLAELEPVIVAMEAAPAAIPSPLQSVELVPDGEKGGKAHLEWSAPPVGATAVAELRIYRREDRAATLEQLRVMFQCQGKSRAQADAAAEEALEALAPEAVRVATLAPGRTRYTENLETLPVSAPLYRVLPVSSFGVEGEGPEARSAFLPPRPDGARLVTAEAVAPPPDAPDFYHLADAVEVRWRLADSDPQRYGEAADAHEALARAHDLPLIALYAVERRASTGQDRGRIIAELPAGESSFVDHPPLELLRRGLQYRVYAVTAAGQPGRTTAACEFSEVLSHDPSQDLVLAAAGAGYLERPTTHERQMIQRFKDEALYEEAKLRFGQREDSEQVWLRWWSSAPEEARIGWLRGMTATLAAKEKGRFLGSWDLSLSERDEPWARAEIFLASQPPQLADEVDRWWSLLDEAARQTARQGWRQSLNAAHRSWLEPRFSGDDDTRAAAEAPARLLIWWSSRGVLEQARLDAWWNDLAESERSAALRAWYDSLPEPARLGVRWPDWETRTAAEQRAALARPPAYMPDPLFKELLAWLAWEDLTGEARLAAIREEVGDLAASTSALKLALRPADKLAGFRLLFWILMALLSSGTLSFVIRGLIPRRR